MVNIDISLSLLRVYFIVTDECLMYIGVNRNFMYKVVTILKL